MIALEVRSVELVEDWGQLGGVPQGCVLLMRSVEPAVSEGAAVHGEGGCEAPERSGREDRAVLLELWGMRRATFE